MLHPKTDHERYVVSVEKHLMTGITVVHPRWTKSTECFLERDQFLIVIDRCEKLGCSMYGIEVEAPHAELIAIECNPGTGHRNLIAMCHGDEQTCKLARELLRALGGSLVAVGAAVGSL